MTKSNARIKFTFTKIQNCMYVVFSPPVDGSNVRKFFNRMSGFSCTLKFGFRKTGVWPRTLVQRSVAVAAVGLAAAAGDMDKIIRRFKVV